MSLADYAELLGPGLYGAIERKGFEDLTQVQRAVLDPALAGRDLRITSQTGSGKTLAIGLSLRALFGEPPPAGQGARPRALIVAPTRELAHQVERELAWLYEDSGVRLATTTGGASYRDEHRALAKGPSVVVGTPGRLLDHLKRGSIVTTEVTTVVLDEADRMLELGFREDLEALFELVPESRTTHLVSATFPRMVRSFADRLQREPAHVEGTRLGAANADIDHVIHVVDSGERLDALINLLLAHPHDQTMVFVRTRADASGIANTLVTSGFAASALSGEMEQAARNRTLAAFREGGLRVLIATDVAARGIDVQEVSRVIHGELPTNPDAYTHRAGRTGRAGRKGTSALLVPPSGVVFATRLLRHLGVAHRFEPIPSPEQIEQADDARTFELLTAEPDPAVDEAAALARWKNLTTKLLEAGELERTLARLLARERAGVTSPRRVRVFPERARFERELRPDKRHRDNGRADPRSRAERPDRPARAERPDRAGRAERSDRTVRAERPDPAVRAERPDRAVRAERPDQAVRAERPVHAERSARPDRPERAGKEAKARPDAEAYTSFHVSWGQQGGADARRVLAMVCRRGQIRGKDVGAIRIEGSYSLVQVANEVAPGFARSASRPDPREPDVVIRMDRAQSPAELESTRQHLRKPARKGGKGGGFRPLRRARSTG